MAQYQMVKRRFNLEVSDALACAELFMVQSKKLDLNKQRPLNTVLFSR
ncbi:TPA: hypothetical protein I7302_10140 [Vibrio vulnificus]|nr:hypothetical protein [Vibrio vulnificus]HAS6955130.1 hypothetical protein [Vibrio vulnificus]